MTRRPLEPSSGRFGLHDDNWVAQVGAFVTELRSELGGVTIERVNGIEVDSYVGALAWSPVDDNLLAVGIGNDIELWNVSTGERTETLTGHDDDVDSLAFSADGRFIASSAYDSIRLWRTP